MPAYKVIYFNYRGSTEAIRYMLSIGGVEYENFIIPDDEWDKYKPSAPYGKVPMLEIDGIKYSHTMAIHRHLAGKFNLLGSNDLEALAAEGAALMVYDLITKPEDITYYYKESFGEEGVKKEVKKYLEETLPSYLDRFEEIVIKNGGYFVNGKLTYADIYFASMIEYFPDIFRYSNVHLECDLLEKYPNLQKLYAKVFALEGIKKWIAKRPKTDF